jgi:nucleotide-binding universal stress UspA family protein
MMFRKILVAHDGSEGAQKAFAAALDLAKRYEAELHMVSVIEVHSHFAATMGEVLEEREEENQLYAQVKQDASRMASECGVRLQARVVTGHEVETIIRLAHEENYDLLVVGFMGHSKVFGRTWGGTSHNLTKLSPCTVLVVK